MKQYLITEEQVKKIEEFITCHTDEVKNLFDEIRNNKDGFVLIPKQQPNMEKQIRETYPEKYLEVKYLYQKISENSDFCNDLRFKYSTSNFISYYEEISSIVDIKWVTEVHLTDIDQIDWLIEQFKKPDYDKWDCSEIFNDRNFFNERYGF